MTDTVKESRFLSPLVADIDDIPYVLQAPLIYQSVRLNATVSVPTGFVTDLASIPRLVQVAIPKEGKYNAPAVIHDWIYAKGCFEDGTPISRADADAVLLEAMRSRKVRGDQALAIYLGVRIGGWVPWGKYRNGKDGAKVLHG